jgi:hypothetical protein
MFLDRFGILMLKIIFLIYFQIKNTLKNNFYHWTNVLSTELASIFENFEGEFLHHIFSQNKCFYILIPRLELRKDKREVASNSNLQGRQ